MSSGWGWRGVLLLAGAVVLFAFGCRTPPLLSNVRLSPERISPNGDGKNDYAVIEYTVGRNTTVDISIVDSSGREYPLRRNKRRSRGSYTAVYHGVFAPEPGKDDRRVLPDGEYSYVVRATAEDGETAEVRGKLTIEDADTTPPLVTGVGVSRRTITPDGDGEDDELVVSYGLSKPARVGLYVVDGEGRRYPLEDLTERTAALHSHRWDGTSGGKLVPDGEYEFHILALDRSGNITDHIERVRVHSGGTPRLEITYARFYPLALPVGGVLNVEIMVKNTGDVPLRTLGPPPGSAYDTQYNFMKYVDNDGQPLYYERYGYWRVGVSWDQAPSPYPVRWGLLPDLDDVLEPGEEATITGTIRILIEQVRQVRFWAAVVQEGRGFGEQVGIQSVTISY